MKSLTSLATLLLLALVLSAGAADSTTPPPLNINPLLTLPAPKPKEPEGWWGKFSAKTLDLSLVVGENRYGLRIPIYPLIVAVILLGIAASQVDAAQRLKKSAPIAATVQIVAGLAIVVLLWRAGFREPKDPTPAALFPNLNLDSLKLNPQISPSLRDTLLAPRDPSKPGSLADDLLKNHPKPAPTLESLEKEIEELKKSQPKAPLTPPPSGQP